MLWDAIHVFVINVDCYARSSEAPHHRKRIYHSCTRSSYIKRIVPEWAHYQHPVYPRRIEGVSIGVRIVTWTLVSTDHSADAGHHPWLRDSVGEVWRPTWESRCTLIETVSWVWFYRPDNTNSKTYEQFLILVFTRQKCDKTSTLCLKYKRTFR